MQGTIIKKISSLAWMPVAAFCLTFGTSAKACDVPRPGSGSFFVPELASIAAAQAASPQIREADDAVASNKEALLSEAQPVSIVGLWQITFYYEGQVVDVGFDVWHTDGTELLNDTPPPATGNVCVGVWTQTGKNTYKLKHPSWTFDSNGNLTGTAVIRENITLSPGGNKFTGTYTISYYDTSGNPAGSFDGQVQATRITPE